MREKKDKKEGYTLGEKLLGLTGVILIVVTINLIFSIVANGQELREPPSIEYSQAQHKVEEGDTLWYIAGWYKVGLDWLVDANPQIDNPNLIYPNERINIPTNFEAWNELDNSGYEENL